MTRAACHRGFTLIESAMAVAIVGVMLVASTQVFSSVARTQSQQAESRLAYLLAQQLMTEIMQRPFGVSAGVLGPTSGQTRAAFDTVDAYNGYAASPPADPWGVAVRDYDNWAESAAVAFVDPANPSNAVATSTLKQITVTVTAPGGKPYTLIGYRSKFGPYEQTPLTQTTYVTGVNVTLRAASPARTVTVGAHPLNVVSAQ